MTTIKAINYLNDRLGPRLIDMAQRTSRPDHNRAKETHPMPTQKRALIVVTSHAQLGDTGKPTGYYLPEVTHPYAALVAREYGVPTVANIPGITRALRTGDRVRVDGFSKIMTSAFSSMSFGRNSFGGRRPARCCPAATGLSRCKE